MGIGSYNLLVSAVGLFKSWGPAAALALLMYYFFYRGIKEEEMEYFAYASFIWAVLLPVSGATLRTFFEAYLQEMTIIWLMLFLVPLLVYAFYSLIMRK